MYTSWADVYLALNIKSDDERMHKVVLQNNEMIIRKKAIIVCSIAEASDLIESERDPQLHHNHQRAMLQAITWGECGYIPDQYDILGLHATLFPFGGDYRTCDVLIKGAAHVPPMPQVIPMLMLDYVEDSRWWLNNPLQGGYSKLAHLHLKFECIHPLTDGNGRVGRVLLNSYAAYLGLPFIKVGPDVRDAYIDCLANEDEIGLAHLFKKCSVRL